MNGLTKKEMQLLNEAVADIEKNARDNAHKRPAVTKLIEEFSELILAFRGKHKDPPELEITQIGGIAINILWQLKAGKVEHVNNIKPSKDK